MNYIGRIITKNKLESSTLFDITSSLKKVNDDIPTLIIGWNNAKTIYGDNLDILDKKISKNLYWTFSKREKRNDYENDITLFYKKVIDSIYEKVKYTYLDFLLYNNNKLLSFINFMKNDTIKKIIYIKDNFIYISYGTDVYGILLDNILYLGYDKKDFLEQIKSNNIVITDDNFLDNNVKKNINNNIIIPYLFSLFN